jgi:amino acid transporter
MNNESPTYSTSSDEGHEKGLRSKSLGLLSSITIGVSSTAPGYSLAATLGFIVYAVAYQSPAIILLAFLPILFIAYAYRELNRETPDCGTTFTWATRVFNPWVGWMGGWGLVAAGMISMASVAQIAGKYFFLMLGKGFTWHTTVLGKHFILVFGSSLANSTLWVTAAGCSWVILLSWVSYRGINVSARLQQWLLGIEMVVLIWFSVVALVKVYTGHAGKAAVKPALSWFNPFAVTDGHGFSFSALSAGLLLAVFLYWGWDTTVSLNEETDEPDKVPGRAALISTLILLITYALVAVACLAYASAKPLENSEDVLAQIGGQVLGTHLDKFLIFAVLTSAAATTQTTIMPNARTLLSMGAYDAIPRRFAKIHERYLTPGFATFVTAGISIAFYAGLTAISENVLGDATEVVGLLVAFYYGLTGFSAAWHFRTNAGSSLRQISARVIMPLIGGIALLGVFVKTTIDDFNPDSSYTVVSVFGLRMGGIFVIAVGSLLLGVILMLIMSRISPAFFAGKTLNRHTPIIVAEHVYAASERFGVPDATIDENTVLPPDFEPLNP